MFLSDSLGKSKTVEHLRHDLLLHFSEESLFEGTDRTFSQVHVDCPHPIHVPLKTSEDSVKKLLREKAEYTKLLESKQRCFKVDEKIIEKNKYADSEYMYIPKHLLEFYQVKDPDPHFDCDYNYYYTGGVLEHVEFDNVDYLIRPDIDNNLCVNNVTGKGDIIKLNYSCSTLIYGLNSSKTDEGLFLVLREKQQVNIVKFKGIDSVDLTWSKDFRMPVFDAKLNEENPRLLGVVLHNRFVVKNIVTDATLLMYKNDIETTECDSLQQFEFLGDRLVVLMTRYKVKVLDYRSKTEEATYDPKLIACNSLCTFRVLENSLLLASRHYVMKSDIRYLSEVYHYSHSLSEPPCYMDYVNKADDTYLCLAGHSVESKVLFTGKSPYSLPYKIPSIKNTLKQCLLANPSLVLNDHLDDRLSYSTTGVKLLNLDDDIIIFSTNTLGELFRQAVSESEQTPEKPVEILNAWLEDLEKPEPVLYVTQVEEMSKARFALNSNPIEHNLMRFKRESKASEFLSVFAPRFKKKNVKGTLALDFLEVWDDEEEEDEEDEVDVLPEVPVMDKVHSWILRQDFSEDDDDLGRLNVSRGSQRSN